MFKLLTALLLCVGVANAADKEIGVGYRDFSGGLNNDDASVSIALNESPSLLNVQIDEPAGALTQRNGYQTCGTIPSGNTITNLYEYSKNDGTRSLIATDNTTVWSTADCVTYSTITTGLNSLDLPRFATVLDNLWIVNGSTWPIVWNGTTASSLDGAGGRPTGPIGKYISYWKSRVWLGTTPTYPSSVYFSALVDDNGAILDPATSTAAWTATNQIYINRDDGSPVYGMKPYRDNLYVFKETGITRVVFESEYDLSVAKNVTTIGSKFNEAIVEMDDGFLRFVGRDGIYAFDGSTVKRLSSKITPTFETLKQPTRGEETRIWDSGVDFSFGVVVGSVSIYSNTGNIGIFQSTLTGRNFGAELGDNTNASNTGWTNSNTQHYFGGRSWQSSLGVYGTDLIVKFYDSNSILISSNSYGWGDETGVWRLRQITPPQGYNTLLVEFICGDGTNVPYKTIRFEGVAPAPIMEFYTKSYGISGQFFFNFDFDETFVAASGRYTSQISTFTGLTQWRSFGVDETENGQTINYFVRTGTSAYNVTIATYSSITSGAIISTGTNKYAQWKAELSNSDIGATPLINAISMGFATGDTSLSVIRGINYKSRYWMSGSTSPALTYNDLTIVESKSPLNTYTLYDLPLTAMAIWSGNLYGAIGNTGKIARLDYGSTDDGAAINSYWNSRDEVYDNPIFYKTINTGILDYSNTPANTGLVVSLSPDEGATWQDRTINLSASTLSRNTKKLNYNANTSLGFRTKVSNNVLGVGFKIYGIHNFGTQTGFYGK